MTTFLYDNTFEGLLSAIFYAYDSKTEPDEIVGLSDYQAALFSETTTINTNTDNAKRVWEGVKQNSSHRICQKLYRVYLSEEQDAGTVIYHYIRLTLSAGKSIDTHYGNPTILRFNNIHKSVTTEAHRAVMFIRFQKTADGMYYAPFDPAYNVLPLTIKHFKDRYADQQWIIYDTKRNYGYHYNLNNVAQITISESRVNPYTGKIDKSLLDTEELSFQELWNDYYQATTIVERKNLKVHKQFLPKRFWKYLPEKNFLKSI